MKEHQIPLSEPALALLRILAHARVGEFVSPAGATANRSPTWPCLATASNPLPAGGSYAEAPQQSVDKAYIHQLQAVAFRYSAMTNSGADLPKRGQLCC
jgi:hypothetical protein